MTELEVIAEQLRQAYRPEDVFGPLTEAKRTFRRLARATHPDRHPEPLRALAEEAFKLLQHLWERAEVRLKAGLYGRPEIAEIPTKHHTYTVLSEYRRGDLATLYDCQNELNEPFLLKLGRHPRNNDLLAAEIRHLKQIHSSDAPHEELRPFVPQVVDSFMVREPGTTVNRQASVLPHYAGWYTLGEVMQEYPTGIDPKDMAWMWRRLLTAIGFAHCNNLVHGAVLPPHILIEPELHGLVLIDWSYSVPTGQPLRALPADYADWYPLEVSEKRPSTHGLDIYLAASCMVAVLGGPASTAAPRGIKAFLRGCRLPHPQQRPQGAWELLEEFDELLEKLWGPRRFHPFYMNGRKEN